MEKFLKRHWLLIVAVVLAYIYRQELLSILAKGKASLSNALNSTVAAKVTANQPASTQDGGTKDKAPQPNQADAILKLVQDGGSRVKKTAVRLVGDDSAKIYDLIWSEPVLLKR